MKIRILFPARLITISAITALSGAFSPTGFAGSLDHDLVDAEASWLIHLNLETFRETIIGNHLEDMSEKAEVEGVSKGGRIKLNSAARLLSDITAYGGPQVGQANDGVLLLHGTPRMTKILEALIINEEVSGEHIEIETIQDKPYPLYLIRKDFYVAIHSPELIVASKSRPLLEQAREVVDGNRPGAKPHDLPGGTPSSRDGFFFLGAAEDLGNHPSLPAKAAILRMARQARLVVGEESENIYLIVELVTKDSTIADRLQKVIQGMLALVSLTAYDNIDFEEFVSRANVESEGSQVTVSLDFPVERLIDMVEEKQDGATAAPSNDAS